MPSSIPPLVRIGEGGISSSTVARLAAAGGLVPVLPGVYLRPDVATELQWRALAVAAWRPDAVLRGQLAAALTFWPELPVTTLEFACRTTITRPGMRFTRSPIPFQWVEDRGRLRLTKPALTALDLSASLGGDAIDRVLRSRQARIADLYAAVAATTHRTGNPERRRLLLDSRAEPWSAAERLAHRLLREARIGGWRANLAVRIAEKRYYLDIAFPNLKLAIEIDGREFHTQAEVFESDRERQNALQVHGWLVLRFTYRMLTGRPDYVIATIRDGMSLASRRLAS